MTASSLPRNAMLGIAFLQGLCLFALYRATDNNAWPSESPAWAFPLWTLAIAAPLLLLLTITRDNLVAAAKYIGLFAVLLTLLAIYVGWQAEPHDAFPIDSLTFAFVVSIGLACFKALMYIQQRADGVPLTYQVLFTNSWRNFLVGVLAAIFTFIFWLILMLWAQLFKVIEIDFFEDLFTEDWFIIPTLTVAFGLGVNLFRALTNVIDNITKLLHWLIKLLLPLMLVVAIIFLAALPFTGLDVLWDTGSGTALMLWLLALLLFFTNAVYQDGREVDPYPAILDRGIYIGLCAMPIVAALSLYGLTLRLMQYGWTVERCWGFVVWLVLTLFAIGYVVGIVRRRDAWTEELATVNKAMGLVVLAIMVLANSPLLDFRKISLASQLERVESGDIELGEFDFWYAKHHLGRPGYLAMEHMKDDIGGSDPALLEKIENPVRLHGAARVDPELLWEHMHYKPEPFDVPAELRARIDQSVNYTDTGDPLIIRADLDGDGGDEYVLLTVHDWGVGVSQLYYLDDGEWQMAYLNYRLTSSNEGARERILDGDVVIADPRFRNLEIGGVVLRPIPNN